MCGACGCERAARHPWLVPVGTGPAALTGVTGQAGEGGRFLPFAPAARGTESVRHLEAEREILARNDEQARDNRRHLSGRGVLALNLMSSPGAGKTTLLVRTLRALAGELPACVIEGDQATDNDSRRVRETGTPAVQINTGRGCHLDALDVREAVGRLDPAAGAVLFIENIGNLVCPAAFDLGEDAKVVLLSVTEGEDKPVKYPDMFLSADLVVLTKCDLLPHLRFDLAEAQEHLRRVNPRAPLLQVSAQTGAGLEPWLDWIRTRRAAALAGAACGPTGAAGQAGDGPARAQG